MLYDKYISVWKLFGDRGSWKIILDFTLTGNTFLASESFPMSQLFTLGGQSIGASASVLPVNNQGWFPLGLTCLISLLSKGLSSLLQHHSSKASILQCSVFLWSNSHIHTWLTKNHSFDYMDLVSEVTFLLFKMQSMFVIAFLPRSQRLLISRLQLPSAVILEPKKIVCHYFYFAPSISHEVMGSDAMILG